MRKRHRVIEWWAARCLSLHRKRTSGGPRSDGITAQRRPHGVARRLMGIRSVAIAAWLAVFAFSQPIHFGCSATSKPKHEYQVQQLHRRLRAAPRSPSGCSKSTSVRLNARKCDRFVSPGLAHSERGAHDHDAGGCRRGSILLHCWFIAGSRFASRRRHSPCRLQRKRPDRSRACCIPRHLRCTPPAAEGPTVGS
jgi:hypothetical protein